MKITNTINVRETATRLGIKKVHNKTRIQLIKEMEKIPEEKGLVRLMVDKKGLKKEIIRMQKEKKEKAEANRYYHMLLRYRRVGMKEVTKEHDFIKVMLEKEVLKIKKW